MGGSWHRVTHGWLSRGTQGQAQLWGALCGGMRDRPAPDTGCFSARCQPCGERSERHRASPSLLWCPPQHSPSTCSCGRGCCAGDPAPTPGQMPQCAAGARYAKYAVSCPKGPGAAILGGGLGADRL
ncbi:hypothetical protein KIL84_020876 [Mauremys mutica]|uniref:Uncharacterized protein n=1 Tax=Mauremys mutica TaxID=74926 RepID=A0A9D4ATX0_9SAUR|nr:hypothetical protein KIL84_020876 [Mauremys mutica]